MIEHLGKIIKTEKQSITVNIEVESACASCHAKTLCSSLDKKNKEITAIVANEKDYEIGETVLVKIKESTGIKAVLLAYFIPFIILTTALLILLNINISEAIAAIISILILALYYLIIYFFRKKIDKKFIIKVEKVYID